MSTFDKDPAAVLDYSFDWSSWLADGEAITAQSVAVPAGLTKGAVSEAAGVVTVWLSGGSVGSRYHVVCQVTTDGGRTDERTMTIEVKDR